MPQKKKYKIVPNNSSYTKSQPTVQIDSCNSQADSEEINDLTSDTLPKDRKDLLKFVSNT